MAFQQPNFNPNQWYADLPKTIDAFFDRYAQARQQAVQNRQAEQAYQTNEANFRSQNFGLSPEDVNKFYPQAMQPQPTAQVPAMLARPDVPQSAPDARGMVTTPQPEDSRLSTLRQLVQMRQQAQQFGVMSQQAGLAKAQGEAREANVKADLIGAPNMPGQVIVGAGNNAGGVLAETAKRYGQGQVPDLFDATGRDPMLRLGLQNQLNKQGINQTDVEAGLTATKAAAGVRGTQGQTMGAMAGSLEDMLNQAEPLIQKLSKSKYELLNSAFISGKKQVNDKDVNELLPLLNSAAGFYATLRKNGGVPDAEDMKSAAKSMSAGLSPSGFAGMKKAVLAEGRSRYQRIAGSGYNQKVDLGEHETRIGRFIVTGG